MPSVLLIEDDGVIARSIGAHLRHGGLDVEWAEDGERGLRKLRFERPDVAVVDLMLPGLDGWTVTERARAEGIVTPIIVISARGSEHDKVHALEIGADDYLAKPFGLAELLARLRALLRRTTARASGRVDGQSLEVDLAAHRVQVGEKEISLTGKEFDVLAVLVANRNKVVSRSQLMSEVWSEGWYGSTKTLDVTIGRLRQKLERAAPADRVVTVRGVGFRLES
jgi:DNA-binding response OmpR family regulator